jgi:hypothetical protein
MKVGTQGPLVSAWQKVMVRRFSAYARESDGGVLRIDGFFGYSDRDVQKEYQRRTGQPQTGEVSDHDLVALGLISTTKPKLPVILCAQGTGVDMWTGPPADVGRVLEKAGKAQFQPLGDWPAKPFPMWPSITAGVASGEVQARKWGGAGHDLWLVGYSQGAVVMSMLWKYSFGPGGVLHDLHDRVKKAVMFGNPCRQQGIVSADGGGPPASSATAGIMVDRLDQTPSWWREFAHKGDLYTDCELDDDEGEFKRAICRIVMGNQWWAGPDNILEQLCELAGRPVTEGFAAVKAILDAGSFFGKKTAPHVSYDIGPAVAYLSGRMT